MIQRARVHTAAVRGVEAEPVLVEVLLDRGLPGTSILGLPDSSVRESRDRVKAAIHSCGFEFPSAKILVNLAPAHTKKEGPWFDLPIALAILAANGMLPGADFEGAWFVGELALDGGVRPVRGALAIALAARGLGVGRLHVAPGSAPLAALVEGLEVRVARDLRAIARGLSGADPPEVARPAEAAPVAESDPGGPESPRLEEVAGQSTAKRALLLAAAGGHNLLFVGPPGAGKSMLARRMPTILPPPTADEALEITKIHDAIAPGARVARRRPFRAPHHTASRAGLVGGGPDVRPGEISLAHGGVLFLDEMAEFPRDTLEALRQPLEDGRITIARSTGSTTFPAQFQLVAAMNPCPCGWKGHPVRPCICWPRDLARYQSRVSGPILDRIDLAVAVPPISPADLAAPRAGLATDEAVALVLRARERQLSRAGVEPGGRPVVNARLQGRALERACPLEASARRLLHRSLERLALSMRAHVRALRVARTIADLEGQDSIAARHVAEALGYRLDSGELGSV